MTALTITKEMQELAETVANQIEEIKKSMYAEKATLDFCRNEALEKVAAEIRDLKGGGTTAKGAELLSYTDKSVAGRIANYTDLAMMFLASKRMEAQTGVSWVDFGMITA